MSCVDTSHIMFFFPSSIAVVSWRQGHHLGDVNEGAPLDIDDTESDEGADENASNNTRGRLNE